MTSSRNVLGLKDQPMKQLCSSIYPSHGPGLPSRKIWELSRELRSASPPVVKSCDSHYIIYWPKLSWLIRHFRCINLCAWSYLVTLR